MNYYELAEYFWSLRFSCENHHLEYPSTVILRLTLNGANSITLAGHHLHYLLQQNPEYLKCQELLELYALTRYAHDSSIKDEFYDIVKMATKYLEKNDEEEALIEDKTRLVIRSQIDKVKELINNISYENVFKSVEKEVGVGVFNDIRYQMNPKAGEKPILKVYEIMLNKHKNVDNIDVFKKIISFEDIYKIQLCSNLLFLIQHFKLDDMYKIQVYEEILNEQFKDLYERYLYLMNSNFSRYGEIEKYLKQVENGSVESYDIKYMNEVYDFLSGEDFLDGPSKMNLYVIIDGESKYKNSDRELNNEDGAKQMGINNNGLGRSSTDLNHCDNCHMDSTRQNTHSEESTQNNNKAAQDSEISSIEGDTNKNGARLEETIQDKGKETQDDKSLPKKRDISQNVRGNVTSTLNPMNQTATSNLTDRKDIKPQELEEPKPSSEKDSVNKSEEIGNPAILKSNDNSRDKDGSLHHEKYNDILELTKLKLAVMLIGPTGLGKGYITQQICEDLGLTFRTIMKVSDSADLIGWVTAGGKFQSTSFHKSVINGGVFFIDEIDGSRSNALISLHSAIGNGKSCYVQFANDEPEIQVHEDFRVIAAANTWGKGSNRDYCGREKLDAATLDRYIPIELDYDERVEADILKDDLELLKFLHAFRYAVYENNAHHIISTRGIKNAAILVKSGKFTREKILQYIAIRDLTKEDLGYLQNGIAMHSKPSNPYLETFNEMIKVRK